MVSTAMIRNREEAARELREGESCAVNVGQSERLASDIGGGVLIAAGLWRGGLSGLALAGLGGMLLVRGMTGHCALYQAIGANTAEGEDQEDATPYGVEARAGVRAEEAITVNRPAEELYRFWRDHNNLPKFMPHVESVASEDGNHAHWILRTPLGMALEWDTAIHTDEPGRMFSWASTDGQLATAGSVHFDPAPGDRGTVARLNLKFDPPLGRVGIGLAKLLGMSPSGLTRETLWRFKQLMETGEIPTVTGQASGRA